MAINIRSKVNTDEKMNILVKKTDVLLMKAYRYLYIFKTQDGDSKEKIKYELEDAVILMKSDVDDISYSDHHYFNYYDIMHPDISSREIIENANRTIHFADLLISLSSKEFVSDEELNMIENNLNSIRWYSGFIIRYLGINEIPIKK